MIKVISSICSVVLLTAVTGQAETADLNYGGWQVSGDVRMGWLDYDYGNPTGDPGINKGHIDSEGYYLVPKLSLATPHYGGLQAKMTLAGATDFGINDEAHEPRNFVFDGTELESFFLLQEAYVTYKSGRHEALFGRYELDTPMINKDDWYMLADTFGVASYTNRGIDDLMLTGGYIYSMAGVWDSGANGTEFHSMPDASFVDPADKARADHSGVLLDREMANDRGVVYGGVRYETDRHDLQLWDYFAIDLYNTFFAQYNWLHGLAGGFDYNFGLQLIDFKEMGKLADHNTTEIDWTLYSAMFDGSFKGGFNFATGLSKYSDGPGQGATLGAWGGYPYFANGMIFHFFEAGSLRNAASYKGQVGYDLGKLGVEGLAAYLRYTYYELDSQYSFASNGLGQDEMILTGVRLSYTADNGVYFTGTWEKVDLDHEPETDCLRLIGGVRF